MIYLTIPFFRKPPLRKTYFTVQDGTGSCHGMWARRADAARYLEKKWVINSALNTPTNKETWDQIVSTYELCSVVEVSINPVNVEQT